MLGVNSPTAQPRSAFNEFFGNVTTGVSEGISRLGSEVMPNWVASQLREQSEDQLFREMYDPEGRPAPVRVEGPATVGSAVTGVNGFMNRVLFDMGGVQITGSGLIIAGGVFLVTVIVLKKVL